MDLPGGESLLFEVSWEVCNKIGGIYTVLSTKAKSLAATCGNQLVFIGPDVWRNGRESPVFLPDPSLLADAAANVTLQYGISLRVGRWNVPGQPVVVLVSFDGVYPHLDEIFGMIWSRFGVDSLHEYGDYREGCAFAVASAIVIDGIARHLGRRQCDITALFNEWTSAMGLLYLQTVCPEAATVFTTHATSIGRSICGNGKPLYDYFTGYNGDQMAAELNMQSKHSLEKAAAHAADCFTTVSDVTARECRQLLDIAPQVVTPNGFEPNFVPAKRTYAALRRNARKRILEIASALTGKAWEDDTFIVATSGRNEYRNKGIDMYIDACLRTRNNTADGTRDILALIPLPASAKCPSPSLTAILAGEAEAPATPDYMTHLLNNQDSDAIACRLQDCAGNASDSRLAIIDIPCYLDGHDGVLDIPYYDFLPALDMTVFASYYEPWGYTPLESIAFGVPTVSTDKAGFGEWVLSNFGNSFAESGVHVISRTDSNYDDAAAAIAADITCLASTDTDALTQYRDRAAQVSSAADWSHFIIHYHEAFRVAKRRRDERVADAPSNNQ